MKLKTTRYLVLLATGLVIGATNATVSAEQPSDKSWADLETRVAQLEATRPAGVPLQAAWQHGIRLQSADDTVRLRIGGRLQGDMAAFDAESDVQDRFPALTSGTKTRRARVYFSGVLYDVSHFRVEYDFLGGNANVRDAYIGVSDIPLLGTVRVGRMLEYYSLEQLSGNSFHQFMERGLPAAFNEYWNNGIGIRNSVFDQRATWAVGAFMRTDNFGDSDTNSRHNVAARITAAPVYHDDGRSWLHLGAGAIRRRPDNNTYIVRSRPESSVAPVFADTGSVPSDRVDLLGLEFAAAHGPATLQAEWHQARVNMREEDEFPHDGTATLNGYYIYAGYFLTGEHRSYNRGIGTVGRTIPNSNFGGEGHGWGAWEVGLRHSELDLNDGPVEGGRLRNITAGLNWYLNPNMRLMWNYVRADLDDAGKAHIYQMRAQFDF